MANVIRDLTKEKGIQTVSQEQEVQPGFEQKIPLSGEEEGPSKEIFGEIKFDNKEGDILKQIGELKVEREREAKESQAPVVATGAAAAAKVAGDDSTDDDDDTGAIPVKYYGYQVSENAFDYLEEKAKKKQNTTEPWLAVWLMRLLQKS